MSAVLIYSSECDGPKTINEIVKEVEGFPLEKVWVKSELWTLPLEKVDPILLNCSVEKAEYLNSLKELTLSLFPFDQDSLLEEMAFFDEAGY